MAVYKCDVCDYLYDEDKEGVSWEDLPDDWVCPVCGSSKEYFERVEGEATEAAAAGAPSGPCRCQRTAIRKRLSSTTLAPV